MTVGTGTGETEEGIHSLAHGLKESIKYTNPDKVIFFGSNLSKKTVKSIKKQYIDDGHDEFPENKLVLIDNVDSFDNCFSAIKNCLEAYKNEEVIIDYTSGTKTMTMSAAICSVLYHKDLILVTGSRGKNGLVTSKTENIITQNLYKVYDELLFDEFRKFFNDFRFIAAEKILHKTVAMEDKKAYMKLAQGYRAWDLFNHAEAKEILTSSKIRQLNAIKSAISQNMSVLGPLASPAQSNKSSQLVADLLNNAIRRGMERKYDDAVARLYRTVELIAQCKLKEELGIDTSDVDLDKLSLLTKSQMGLEENGDNKVNVGLYKGYDILKYEDNEIGRKFSEDRKLKDLLKRRNLSILAHGLKSIGRKEYEELLEKTVELALYAYPDVKKFMEKAEFPKL